MQKDGTTRREFLKTVGSVSLLALANPLITSCADSGNTTPDYSGQSSK